jgi:L-fuculose-phosphate aldolase
VAHDELRRRLIETAVAMNGSGISQGTSGNLSARCTEGMLITPSGMNNAGLESADIVLVDQMGKPHGNRLPSSEWRIHQDIYAVRADAGAILHAHPGDLIFAATLSQSLDGSCPKTLDFGRRKIPSSRS